MRESEKVDKDGKIQLIIRVTPQVKQLAEEEAHLAYLYGWISKPSMPQLFTWLVEDYLARGVRDFITRRKVAQDSGKQVPQDSGKQVPDSNKKEEVHSE